ncbi:phosphoribosylanthranilate isomerase [Leucobacter viscericola]|uniref:N-(5'-phosphoribosyl)anthranilate isomerase n=1 Tax=Leucobacter viscericola TaxID=2714935 RepID=A0A6G7XBU5_9MICO|nr:phosphoribosylanthranilate isomerase [Leucobacter viscericola]QIK61877.1 phosphoribosylanthranilate isomerase [Leucobacter viscericola]
MYVKICGLRDADVAQHAVNFGADAIGVVMGSLRPRDASPETAAKIVSTVKAASTRVDTVLVVNRIPASEAAKMARDLGFDVLQLHGDAYELEDFTEARAILPRVWRATSLATHPELQSGEYSEEHLLVDGAQPGSGETWDLARVKPGALGAEWILAGGLTPENVSAAISATSPWGVDVSSGVESAPGVKDLARVERFIRAAKQS